MKIDTTSTAEQSKGATKPAAGASGGPPRPDLEPAPVRRTGSFTYSAEGPRPAPSSPSGRTLLRHLSGVVLIVTLVGAVGTSGHHLYRWYAERLRESAIDSTLVALRSRQRQYEKMNQAYGGSMAELKMKLPPEIARGVRVFAGSIGDVPAFVAEYCDGVSCALIDARGHIMPATGVARATGNLPLPELKEGEGRIYGFTQSAGH